MTLTKRPAAKITHINTHLITLPDKENGTMLLKGLKKRFVKNKEQTGRPLSVVSKTQGKCQFSVKF